MAIQTKDFSVTGKSASGSITYTYILRVTENSAGIVNGKPVSNVTVNAILKQSYSGLSFSQWTTTVTCSINGVQRFSDSAQRRLEGTSEHNYYTWTGDIEHNADGQLSITVGGSLWLRDPGQAQPQPLTIVEDSNNVMVLTPVTVTTACTAPTSFTASPAVAEKGEYVKLSWSGASGGSNNPITTYEIQYTVSEDGTNWNGWHDWITTSGTTAGDTPGISRGWHEKYRVRARGSAGSSYYSEWKESNVVTIDNEPYIYIHDNGYEKHLAHIHDGKEWGKYMPYEFDGTSWNRIS